MIRFDNRGIKSKVSDTEDCEWNFAFEDILEKLLGLVSLNQ